MGGLQLFEAMERYRRRGEGTTGHDDVSSSATASSPPRRRRRIVLACDNGVSSSVTAADPPRLGRQRLLFGDGGVSSSATADPPCLRRRRLPLGGDGVSPSTTTADPPRLQRRRTPLGDGGVSSSSTAMGGRREWILCYDDEDGERNYRSDARDRLGGRASQSEPPVVPNGPSQVPGGDREQIKLGLNRDLRSLLHAGLFCDGHVLRLRPYPSYCPGERGGHRRSRGAGGTWVQAGRLPFR